MLKFVLVIHLAGYPMSLVLSEGLHKLDCEEMIYFMSPSIAEGASLECEPIE